MSNDTPAGLLREARDLIEQFGRYGIIGRIDALLAEAPATFEAYRKRSLGPFATPAEEHLARHAWDAALASQAGAELPPNTDVHPDSALSEASGAAAEKSTPVGYLAAYELDRLKSGHDARLRSAKPGPSALDGDVSVYLAEPEITEEDDALRAKLSALLTGVANALRGDPGPLRSWSWHDLPDRAAAAIAMIDVLQRALANGETDVHLAVPDNEGKEAMKVTDEMVSRFLTWKLPDDFGPDCGIVFAKFHPNGTTRFEPVGTNLLTAPQARAMLEHVLGAQAGAEPPPVTFGPTVEELRERIANLGGAQAGAEPPRPAARDVLAERQRQVEAEGWTPEHDDEHGDNSMAVAAACYALAEVRGARVQDIDLERLWQWTGWSRQWFKPKDKRRNLVRAGALILAEIERLDRGALAEPQAGPRNQDQVYPAQADDEGKEAWKVREALPQIVRLVTDAPAFAYRTETLAWLAGAQGAEPPERREHFHDDASYLAAHAQAGAEPLRPLTDEQIYAIAEDFDPQESYVVFARAILAARGALAEPQAQPRNQR